ncbi:hypothetical protein SDC9_193201 [bioreactor metagenome]|uniref:Uncharacterized protein n=1 Tax=bioreactor metagenome TaxID=1076179 RepID=A0A645IDZ5_9ZZZZ
MSGLTIILQKSYILLNSLGKRLYTFHTEYNLDDLKHPLYIHMELFPKNIVFHKFYMKHNEKIHVNHFYFS